ncbi:MAG: DUF1049 domain-containing protein [Nitrospinae bacterium]|nr:DUF1049 domain-containing protein [Nitrospinota bacterium]MBF0633320.1 DUF1049 domain-containing protein [Nitrospinota bacterium]
MAVKLIFGLAVVFMFVSFAALNQKSVTVTYYGYEGIAPVWLVSVISFALGAVAAGALGAFTIIREKSRSFSLSRRLARAEDDLRDMRQKSYAQSGQGDQSPPRSS